jgi:hypothetical protein
VSNKQFDIVQLWKTLYSWVLALAQLEFANLKKKLWGLGPQDCYIIKIFLQQKVFCKESFYNNRFIKTKSTVAVTLPRSLRVTVFLSFLFSIYSIYSCRLPGPPLASVALVQVEWIGPAVGGRDA